MAKVRLGCAKCGHVLFFFYQIDYGTSTEPPKFETVCSKCGHRGDAKHIEEDKTLVVENLEIRDDPGR